MPDILMFGGPSGTPSGQLVVVYDTDNNQFDSNYNDPTQLSPISTGVGSGVSAVRVWACGTTVRYGYFGAMDAGHVPYRVDSLSTNTDMRTLPGYGTMARHEFVGSAGNKALFVDRISSPTRFQIFDADTGEWEGVISGPTGANAPGVTYGAEMTLTETGSIFFVPGFGSSSPWNGAIAHYDGSWNVIAMNTQFNINFGTPQIWCPNDDTIIAYHRRAADPFWGYVGRWARVGGWTDIVTTNLIPEGLQWTSGALLDDATRLMIHAQNGRLMLIDLGQTNTRLGYALMPVTGNASINFAPHTAGVSSTGFMISWPSNMSTGSQAYAVKYDENAVDEFHSLVGGRGDNGGVGFGTFAGPSDSPITTPNDYTGLIGVWSAAPATGTNPTLTASPASPNSQFTTTPLVWSTASQDATPASIVSLTIEGETAVSNNVVQSGWSGTVTLNADNGYTVSIVATSDRWQTEYQLDWSVDFNNGFATVTETGSVIKYVTVPPVTPTPVPGRDTDQRFFSFPMRFEANADIPTVPLLTSIQDTIRNAIFIRKGGVPLSADLGSRISTFPFDPNDDILKQGLLEEIINEVAMHEPRATLDPTLRTVGEGKHDVTLAIPFTVQQTRNWQDLFLSVEKAEIE